MSEDVVQGFDKSYGFDRFEYWSI